jgi:hypothetical protein
MPASKQQPGNCPSRALAIDATHWPSLLHAVGQGHRSSVQESRAKSIGLKVAFDRTVRHRLGLVCSTQVIRGKGFYYVYTRQASGIRLPRSAAVTIKRTSQTGPVTVPEWQDFLHSYSDDYLRVSTEENLAYLEDAQRENRWLGYEPASEDAVRAAEEQLGVRLPQLPADQQRLAQHRTLAGRVAQGR